MYLCHTKLKLCEHSNWMKTGKDDCKFTISEFSFINRTFGLLKCCCGDHFLLIGAKVLLAQEISTILARLYGSYTMEADRSEGYVFGRMAIVIISCWT